MEMAQVVNQLSSKLESTDKVEELVNASPAF